MRYNKVKTLLFVFVTVVAGTISNSCASSGDHTLPMATTSEKGKIPITTSSQAAKDEFLKGRDLAERLLQNDSVQYFDKAISLDPNFAMAELGRANVSATAKEFFEHLKKAVNLSGKVSEGERLFILAAEANANGNPTAQKESLDKLLTLHPDDERAHFSLAGYYFGRQDFAEAVNHYKKATQLAPAYSGAYNLLGYAYRQMGDYANSEQAFKKYIELIPNDPNPYDSLAELLLKMGKFDDSIAQYRKALAIDSNFVPSHLGISADLMYAGKPAEAESELQKINDKARNEAERRLALRGLIVLSIDSGKFDKALEAVDKQYAMAEKGKDDVQMAEDLQLKGDVLTEMGRFDEAKSVYDRALKTIEDAAVSAEIKENARTFHHYNMASIALGKKDYALAKTETEQFRQGAEAIKDPRLQRQAHELAGRIALAEADHEKALAELKQSDQENPYNLYRICQVYQAQGKKTEAKDFCTKATNFNSLPQINLAFIRTKAGNLAAEL